MYETNITIVIDQAPADLQMCPYHIFLPDLFAPSPIFWGPDFSRSAQPQTLHGPLSTGAHHPTFPACMRWQVTELRPGEMVFQEKMGGLQEYQAVPRSVLLGEKGAPRAFQSYHPHTGQGIHTWSFRCLPHPQMPSGLWSFVPYRAPGPHRQVRWARAGTHPKHPLSR